MNHSYKVGDKVSFREPVKPHFEGTSGKIIALTLNGYLVESDGGPTFFVNEAQVSPSAAESDKDG